jgi:transposase
MCALKVRDQRGLLRSALGYAVRQKNALMRVLEDGRLVIDNNRSERALRQIAIGRKAWLFVGSDGHAESAGHILSLVASCRLHGLDPEVYLRDLFRVLAHWPRDRFLELAPKYWAETRTRLDPRELAAEVGPLTVHPPVAAPEEKAPASRTP